MAIDLKLRFRRLVAIVAAISTFSFIGTPGSSHAMTYEGEYPAFVKLHYSIDPTFWSKFGGPGMDALHYADRAWTPQYQIDRFELRDWGGTTPGHLIMVKTSMVIVQFPEIHSGQYVV